MTDERLAVALKAGMATHTGDTIFLYTTDEKILRITEGTMLRATTELALAWEDLEDEIRNKVGPSASKILFALARFIGWFTRGKRK